MSLSSALLDKTMTEAGPADEHRGRSDHQILGAERENRFELIISPAGKMAPLAMPQSMDTMDHGSCMEVDESPDIPLIAVDFTLYASPLRMLSKQGTNRDTAHAYLSASDMIAADLTKYNSPLNTRLLDPRDRTCDVGPTSPSKCCSFSSLRDCSSPQSPHATGEEFQFELRRCQSDTVYDKAK